MSPLYFSSLLCPCFLMFCLISLLLLLLTDLTYLSHLRLLPSTGLMRSVGIRLWLFPRSRDLNMPSTLPKMSSTLRSCSTLRVKKKKKDVHVSAYKHTPFDVTNQKGPTHQPYTYKLATHVNWQTKTFLITLLSLDVAVQLPDKKSILMYVTSLFAVLPNDVTMDDIREVETLPRKYKVDEGHPASTQVNRRKR